MTVKLVAGLEAKVSLMTVAAEAASGRAPSRKAHAHVLREINKCFIWGRSRHSGRQDNVREQRVGRSAGLESVHINAAVSVRSLESPESGKGGPWRCRGMGEIRVLPARRARKKRLPSKPVNPPRGGGRLE